MPCKDPEKAKEYRRLYYLKNEEKIKEKQRLYRIENKEKTTEYQKEHRQTPAGIKSQTISNWRRKGVLDHFNDNFETLYRIYLSTKFCDECAFELNTGDNGMRKCLDHHHDSGYFRNILCNSCNVKRG